MPAKPRTPSLPYNLRLILAWLSTLLCLILTALTQSLHDPLSAQISLLTDDHLASFILALALPQRHNNIRLTVKVQASALPFGTLASRSEILLDRPSAICQFVCRQ